MRVVLFGRPGCHQCEDARAVLERVGEPIAEVDVTADDALHARMLERIPVVAVDGREVFDHFVDEDSLRAHLS